MSNVEAPQALRLRTCTGGKPVQQRQDGIVSAAVMNTRASTAALRAETPALQWRCTAMVLHIVAGF